MAQIRNTPSKRFIQQALNDAGRALSLSEIQEATSGICDRVTVYRVLERLLNEGEVHRTVSLDGVVHYAKCSACETNGHTHAHDHHHVHFHCESCGDVTCLESVIPEFKLPRKYELHETNFTVSGLCPGCR